MDEEQNDWIPAEKLHRDRLADEERRQEEDRAAAEAAVQRKWVRSKQCPICRVEDWGHGFKAEIRVADGREGITYPVFPMICNNCGFTVWFNARILMREPRPKP